MVESKSSKPESNRRVRILVVEDVPNVATVLKARLESFGDEICAVADTGPKAIASTLSQHPDIVLMDIILVGEMNGIEAASEILKKFDVPIIYLSCLNDQDVMDRAIETNPYGYILKPYDSAALRFAIENALRKFRQDQERQALIADLERSRNE